MTVDDFTVLEELREACQNTTPAFLLSRNCDPDIATCFNRVIREYFKNGRLMLGNPAVTIKIIHELEKHGVERTLIDSFCINEFQDAIVYPSIVIEIIAYVFQLNIGIFWSHGEVLRRCPNLEFDEDGLLVGPESQITFQRDGVRCGHYLIPYNHEIQSYGLGLSGGLIEHLSCLIKKLAPSYFGLRIEDNMVYDPFRFVPIISKAYIRGPKGLTADLLNSQHFPENPQGTVTVHQRISQDPVAELELPLLRTEIMWSSKDGLKTIQIEELVPQGGRRNRDDAQVSNRYLHSMWDPKKGHFIHIDGAIRSYADSDYGMRLQTDLKHAREVPAEYHKLFRVDAAVPLHTWCDLAARYFYHNELVVEYLGEPGNNQE